MKKLKKSSRYIAGGLECIFAVIDHKIYAFIFGCGWLDIKTFGIWGTFLVVLLFEFFAPNLLQIDPYRIYFKIIYFWPPWVKYWPSPRTDLENFVKFEFLTPKLP
jgi:hypothetical protein